MSISFAGGLQTAGNANKCKEFNEFAKIEGLGPAMQRWLRETFHVYTVADLANLSVNRVLSRLEDEEQAFCRHEIERWIQQAQGFAAQQSSWRTFATFVVSLQSRQVGGQTEQRTTAYFLEADRRAIWSGIECNGVYELMLDQLKHIFQPQPEVSAPMEPELKIEPELRDNSSSASESGSVLEAVEQESAHEPDRQPEPVDERSSQLESETQAEPLSDSSSEPEAVAAVIEIEVETPGLESYSTTPAESVTDEEPLEFTSAVASEPESEMETDVAVAEPLTLKITQLKFWQPPEAEKSAAEDAGEEEPEPKKARKVDAKKVEAEEPEPESAIVVNMAKRSLPGMLHAAKPFQIEVTFQLTGAGAVDLTRESLNYHIQCFIQNREVQRRIPLENSATGTFTNGKSTCTRRLPEITSLQPGFYRLQVVTQLKGGYASPDLLELPFVQVV